MNVIDLVAIIPFYLSLLLEGLEDFEIIGKDFLLKGNLMRLFSCLKNIASAIGSQNGDRKSAK
jgi:hypothetical protein